MNFQLQLQYRIVFYLNVLWVYRNWVASLGCIVGQGRRCSCCSGCWVRIGRWWLVQYCWLVHPDKIPKAIITTTRDLQCSCYPVTHNSLLPPSNHSLPQVSSQSYWMSYSCLLGSIVVSRVITVIPCVLVVITIFATVSLEAVIYCCPVHFINVAKSINKIRLH